MSKKHNIEVEKKITKTIVDGKLKCECYYYITQSLGFSFNSILLKGDEIDWLKEQLDIIK